jgi:hypothetical protein
MRILLRTALAAIGLLAATAATAANDDGARPGDDAMTCQQIAMALMPNVKAIDNDSTRQLGRNAEELRRRSVKREAELQGEGAADTAAMEAGCFGGINATCAAASEALSARQAARNAKIQAEDKPITDQMNPEMAALAAQGQAMQQDPRMMHLMQLAQQKHCH